MSDSSITGFPQAIEAERAVLGGLLMDPLQVPTIAEILTKDDFYSGAHGRLFQVLLDRSNKHETIDQLVIGELVASSPAPE